jgi:murein DD-endopeptidase MepM/ murein hydrolase activator NlpD
MSLRRIVLLAFVTAVAVAVPRVDANASNPHWVRAAAVGTLAPAYGTYAWPVVGRIVDPFRPPSGPYGSGHRGIDIAAPFGTPVHAASDGVVAFAGSVAGSLFVSIDHPDGVRATYGWLSSIAVSRGDVVVRDQVIGASGYGHPGKSPTHLHFGARLDGAYIDPLPLLVPLDVTPLIHLAPMAGLPGGHSGRRAGGLGTRGKGP